MTVIIDPATGRLIDIEQFNYFYDFAQGSNSSVIYQTLFRFKSYINVEIEVTL